jgi:flagellar basal-body rod protein FlgC
MSIDNIFGIADSALSAQSARLTLIAQNLANADSVEAANGRPYQRRIPVFMPESVDANGAGSAAGVKLAAVLRDQTAPSSVYDPTNPLANSSGMVQQPTVNPICEMVDLMQASRSYQANLSVIESAHTAALKTLDLLK